MVERVSGIWGSYNDIPKAIFYLLRGLQGVLGLGVCCSDYRLHYALNLNVQCKRLSMGDFPDENQMI